MHRLIYRCLRLIFISENFILRHFTLTGQGVLACLIITAIIGMGMTQSFHFVTFSFALCLLGISCISCHFIGYPLEITRVVPPYGTVGEPLQYRLLVRNQSSVKQTGLTLLEAAATVFPCYEEFESVLKTGQNGWQKFRAWQALLITKQWAREFPMNLPTLPVDEDIEISAKLTPLKRGYLPLKAVTIAVADPLGLMNQVMVRSQLQSILILPKLYQLPEIQFFERGKSKAGPYFYDARMGESAEFLSLRNYQFGDPPRKIHWKSWAKTGKPIVQDTQFESAAHYAIVFDTFQTQNNRLIFEQAVALAISLVCELQSPKIILDIVCTDSSGIRHVTEKGLNHIENTLIALATIEPSSEDSFAQLKQSLSPLLPQLDAVIGILVDWDETRNLFFEELSEKDLSSKLFYLTPVHKVDQATFTQTMANLQVHILRSQCLQEDLMRI